MPRRLAILLALSSAPAAARDIHWGEELGADVIVGGTALGIDRFAPKTARYDGGGFPTQGFDDGARRIVHGRTHGAAVSKGDSAWRSASNATVVTAAALPAALAFFADDDAALGRILTTGHALLMSNLAVEAAKKAVRRPRPKARDLRRGAVEGDDALSFPSGHTAAAFTGATLVSRFFPEAAWLRGGAYALAGLTGVARMAGDKHYLTDVLIGGALGSGAAVLADEVYEKRASPVSFRPQIGGFQVTYRF